MTEEEWVERIAKRLRATKVFTSDRFEVKTRSRLAYEHVVAVATTQHAA